MREYKFRGKRVDTGEWVYGSLVILAGSRYYIKDDSLKTLNPRSISTEGWADIRCFEVDPSTVGQYTGLKDKNGKEIYEGDIAVHRTKPKEKFIVVWHDNGFMLEYEFTRMYEGKSWQERNYSPIYESYEIIGNIHDNPELLKEVE